jgi:hypothetical protein
MSLSAQVTSIDALKELRVRLCEFGVDAQQALDANRMEIRRTFDWLEERLRYWQLEIRERQEEMTRAKQVLVQRRWGSEDGRGSGATEAEIALKEAKRRLAEAEAKAETVRRWQQQLPRAVHEYEGPARQLMGYLEADQRQALAMLDRMAAALEAYVALTPPPGSGAPAVETPPAPAAPDTGQTS